MANKQAALDFLRMAAAGKAQEAGKRFLAPGFRHHNPWFPAGAAPLLEAMDENARQNPGKAFEPLRSAEEGDLVMVHSRVRLKPGGPDLAVVHVFRFEAGRVAELWDVGQQAPADSPNRDGAF
ncbi:MAG TPA: nuclear transport factor 2 family protein [Candidatus Thermoplasmatota archaeon]|nr:nuclear transport factor 2 family protein [Candidatus Thermoplasmatota archaeon]